MHPVLDDQNHVDGYEATNTVTARIRDLGTAGSVIDSAAERAGDNIVVQGITFSIDDDSELLANARTKATRRARAQAEQLASGAGVEVGDVKSISEATSSVPLAYAADAAREAASTPVEPGSADVVGLGHGRVHHPLTTRPCAASSRTRVRSPIPKGQIGVGHERVPRR